MTVPGTNATVYYFRRHPLYEQVKPYLIDYEVENGFPRTNIIPEPHEVFIQNLRGAESSFSFDENGFAVLEMQSAMEYEDFDDKAKIKDVYLGEISSCLLRYFNARAVHIFDFAVRNSIPQESTARSMATDLSRSAVAMYLIRFELRASFPTSSRHSRFTSVGRCCLISATLPSLSSN